MFNYGFCITWIIRKFSVVMSLMLSSKAVILTVYCCSFVFFLVTGSRHSLWCNSTRSMDAAEVEETLFAASDAKVTLSNEVFVKASCLIFAHRIWIGLDIGWFIVMSWIYYEIRFPDFSYLYVSSLETCFSFSCAVSLRIKLVRFYMF